MSAYRICEECGAALDPGERCDCRPEAPLKLIQPGSARVGTYLRHERLLNEVFAGVPLEFTLGDLMARDMTEEYVTAAERRRARREAEP